MRVLVSGATGFVGRFIVEHLTAAGETVIAGCRRAPDTGFFSRPIESRFLALDPALDQSSAFDGIDVFVHAAFQHVPGRYRGGEGDDPEGFRLANSAGSIRLFEAARAAGVSRCLFLSSRAVYGRQPPGISMTEETPVDPVSLYGLVKLEAERALAGLDRDGFATASLRATGVYGEGAPGKGNKWTPLLDEYLRRKPVADRVGTEVHGDDLAAAVLCLIRSPADMMRGVFNVSDILTGYRDVLAIAAQTLGSQHPLPEAADGSDFNAMDTERLRALGWQPGGRAKLEETVRRMAAAHRV
ncbi:NAD-dependent epimerase/dehydratase family protein [Rhizobium sp. YIM 134829]|uniref:NAD-dependent epimerase/dehydratase family protein n=1 Tax=Rhizobium sp. YIM 134829 TaxID=3390453 RepID=UPI00397B3831